MPSKTEEYLALVQPGCSGQIVRPAFPVPGQTIRRALGKLDGLFDHCIPAVQVPLCRPADDLRPAPRCHRLRRL